MTIEKLADCNVQAVTHFLNSKNTNPVDTHQDIVSIYEKEAMSEGSVRN